jgi:hypothetical protein
VTSSGWNIDYIIIIIDIIDIIIIITIIDIIIALFQDLFNTHWTPIG